jgi:transposase-like protein
MTALTATQFTNETSARAHLEAIRSPSGPACPHCGSVRFYRLEGKAHRPGLLKRDNCEKQYSVTVGAVFERSKGPLTKWLMAVYLLTSSKKGISRHQIHSAIGVTDKTAWFMTHRIREAMSDIGGDMLGGPGTSGIVEADETYFGKTRGQGKGGHLAKKQKVVALLERSGRVCAFHIPRVNADTLKPTLEANIAKTANLMTDKSPVYKKVSKSFESHERVNHGRGEYARVEGYFGILKHGISACTSMYRRSICTATLTSSPSAITTARLSK